VVTPEEAAVAFTTPRMAWGAVGADTERWCFVDP
jgi:hypothetical protein